VSPRLAAMALAVSLMLGAGVPIAVAWTRPKRNAGSLETVVRRDGGRPPLVPARTGAAASTFYGQGIRVHPARLADRTVAARSVQPTRVLIPSLGMSAAIEPVGVAADRPTLEIPRDVDVVGWYRFGPAPGERGSAVLVGHVDSHDQGPGAFFRLRSLAPGARVIVQLADGQAVRYRVLARRSYVKGGLPGLLFARDGAPVLALVTCGGSFDQATRHYSDNVVVFAVPLEE
jgi:sortase family protein